ncbi:MAG: T9SS type A sorting domain-containing protein [Bacteroidota bacterium]|nr:T9SS type A sorting domain-containing protein [Bacteroidota bacterium]
MRFLFVILFIASAALTTDVHAQDWEQLGGPKGSRLKSMVRAADGSVTAWQSHAGFVRSTDGGLSWQRMTRERPTRPLSPVRQAIFERHGILYAEHYPWTSIHRSTDNGAHWDSIPAPSGYELLTVTPEHEILVQVGLELQASADTGRSWRTLNLSASQWVDGIVLAVGLDDGSWFVHLENDGLYRSTDRGAQWDRIIEGIPDAHNEALVLIDDARLFSCMHDQLRLSSDGGQTWELCTGVSDRIRGVVRRDHYYMLAWSWSTLYRSTDQGVSWAPLTTPDMKYIYQLLALEDGTLLANVDDRLLRSTDAGMTWTESMEGLHYPGYPMLMDHRPDATLLTCVASGARRSSDYGVTWVRVDAPDRSGLGGPFLYARDGAMYAFDVQTSGDCRVYRSTDGGAGWRIRGIIPASARLRSVSQESMTEGSTGLILADREGRMLRSTDEGVSWQPLGGLITEMQAGATLQKLQAFAHPDDNIILAAASGPAGGLFRSTDGGSSWSAVDLPESAQKRGCGSLVLTGSTIAYARTDSLLHRSVDRGARWESVLRVNASDRYEHLQLDARDELYCYLPQRNTASEIHVLHSVDNGGSWEPLSLPSLPAPPDEIIGVHFDDQNRFYVSTFFDGAFRLRFPLSARTDASALPDRPRLTGVYPQPLRAGFDATLRVQVSLPAAEAPLLQLCDVSGRVLRAQAAGSLSPGLHALRIDASGLAAGSYLLRIVQNGAVASTRMIVIN